MSSEPGAGQFGNIERHKARATKELAKVLECCGVNAWLAEDVAQFQIEMIEKNSIICMQEMMGHVLSKADEDEDASELADLSKALRSKSRINLS